MSETPSTPATHPEPSVDVPAPAVGALYSARQVALATLVATPLAGALLAASNARAIGRSDALRAVIVVTGAAVTALIFGVDVWGAGPFTLFALPVSAGGAYVASSVAFARWLPRAPRCTNVSVVGIVVACWLALGGVGAGVVGAAQLRAPSADEALGDHVQHSARELVSFQDGARREDAEEVARALVTAGAFTGTGALRLDVDRADVDRADIDHADVDRADVAGENPPGELRVRVRIPDGASLDDLEAARVLLKNIARHLTPPRCIKGRVVSASGLERANGRLCP